MRTEVFAKDRVVWFHQFLVLGLIKPSKSSKRQAEQTETGIVEERVPFKTHVRKSKWVEGSE